MRVIFPRSDIDCATVNVTPFSDVLRRQLDRPEGAFVAPTWVPWAGCATCIVLLAAEIALETSL